MKFDSVRVLLKYLKENNIDFSKVEIDLPVPTSPVIKSEVTFKFASGDFVTEAVKGDENVLYVEHFESIPNLCGTGKVVINGKTLWLNMCESEGITKVSLPLTVKGVTRSQQFTLKYINEKAKEAAQVILADI